MNQPSTRPTVSTILPTGLVLLVLFFGVGNPIFPLLLGVAPGRSPIPVMVGFLVTEVLISLITVVAVSTSGEGVLDLARRVGPRFGVVMPLAAYLAISPLYAIVRVTTATCGLMTRPVLELLGTQNSRLVPLMHVTVFMGMSFSTARNSNRLADCVGRWFTFALLALLTLLCGATIMTSPGVEHEVIESYADNPLTNGLAQGYLIVGVLAVTVFGIVVITSLYEHGLTSPYTLVRGTALPDGIAAMPLGLVCVGLAALGMRIRGQVTVDTKGGAALLHNATFPALGTSGVVVSAAIVILACLTTAVGLMTSWAGYAYTAWSAVSFNWQLVACTVVSFTLVNLGLSTTLKITGPLPSLPYSLTVAPVAVILVDAVVPGRLKAAYRWHMTTVGILGSVPAITAAGWDGPSRLLVGAEPWSDSTGWTPPTFLTLGIDIVLDIHSGAWSALAPGEPPNRAQQGIEHAATSQL